MKIKILVLSVLSFISFGAYSQKIFMTGDSHVSIKVYPREVGRLLEESKPEANFSFWGKGGAGFYSFNDNRAYMDSIFNAQPDVLVVHLGTNGSYAVKFDPEKCHNDISTFHSAIREQLPDCKIVYVTPFYNKNRQKIGTKTVGGKKKGKKKSKPKTVPVYGPWNVNHKTRECSDVILTFAESQPDTYVIDNNADAGTIFLDEPGLIRSEYVHLTDDGYKLLARQVTDKLLEINELWESIPE